jgi:hypothetical protein
MTDELMFQCFTDPRQWAAAHWGATAFLYDISSTGQVPPGIGIAFRNFQAGKQIFDDWIKRLGHLDAHEELRVSIIEGPYPHPKEGKKHESTSTANDYTVFLSSNLLNTIKRKQQDDPDFNPTKFVRFAQMNRMAPVPGSPHLRLFKAHFARLKRYRLFPALFDGSQIKDLDLSRYVEKQELNLLRASDLKPDQAEHAVLDRPY